MSVSNAQRLVTKQDLKDFYDGILPYLGGSADAGFTPVGTIISVMGVTAPANYLACNGQIVNIADYPELADYFYQQFGSKNKFGGDGTTTFGIPDLRGEFLRGTGTNSHTNQGSGTTVGTHQDSTKVPFLATYLEDITQASKIYIDLPQLTWENSKNGTQIRSGDGIGNQAAKPVHYARWNADMTYESSANTGEMNVRPTNTSVLYCIATKNIYMNPSLDYSTSEKVVGTWIDGATLYQKTIEVNMPQVTTDGESVTTTVDLSSDIEKIYYYDAIAIRQQNGRTVCNSPVILGTDYTVGTYVYFGGTTNLSIKVNNIKTIFNPYKYYITIRYTKVTT